MQFSILRPDLRDLNADYTLVVQSSSAQIPFRIVFELDGQQHFEKTYFGGQITDDELIRILENQQENDKYQDEFCIEKGYKIMRISYSVPLDKFQAVIKYTCFGICSHFHPQIFYWTGVLCLSKFQKTCKGGR